ncbi:MAG TPA: hypothetical protein VMS12_06150 [Thermoanaerobaculia bacterium]|nr:hypothetical protein [Thermoanaerobaculia bacterium]
MRATVWFAVSVSLVLSTISIHAERSIPSSVRVTPSETHRGMLHVDAKGVSLRELVAAVQLHVDHRIVLRFEGDRLIRLTARDITPAEIVRRAARLSALHVSETAGSMMLTDPLEPVLHLDVKNASVRDILRSVREQCGIRNLIIDQEVSGQGTFLFTGVPCGEGLRVILASLGLAAEVEKGLVRVKGSDR